MDVFGERRHFVVVGDVERAAQIAEGLRPEALPFRSSQARYWVRYGEALARMRGRHEDAVRAFLLAAGRDEADGGVFNVGVETSITLRELAELLVSLHGGGAYDVAGMPASRSACAHSPTCPEISIGPCRTR